MGLREHHAGVPLVRFTQGVFHGAHVLGHDALVPARPEEELRARETGHAVEETLRDAPSVVGDRGRQRRLRIRQERRSTAHAEPDGSGSPRVHVRTSGEPCLRGAQVGREAVQGESSDVPHHLFHLVRRAVEARGGSVEELGRERRVTSSGEPFGHVADVSAYAEGVLQHQDARSVGVPSGMGRPGPHRGAVVHFQRDPRSAHPSFSSSGSIVVGSPRSPSSPSPEPRPTASRRRSALRVVASPGRRT